MKGKRKTSQCETIEEKHARLYKEYLKTPLTKYEYLFLETVKGEQKNDWLYNQYLKTLPKDEVVQLLTGSDDDE